VSAVASRLTLGMTLLLVLLAPLACKRAEGVEKDPVEHEAEEALVEYLRIDTSNPPGRETAGAKFLQQLFVKNGIEAQLVGANPERQAVFARLKSKEAKGALLLLNHIDVVPTDGVNWTNPPFAGTRSGGYIWGRGALDMKSLAIAQAMSLIDLKRRNVALRRDVVFLAVPDEELGGREGTGALLENQPDLFTGVEYVLNEGGSTETVVDKAVAWGIEIQQKTPLWLRITTEGMAGHAASPPDGGGAVAKLIRALAAIEKIETPYRMIDVVKTTLDTAKSTRHDPGVKRLAAITEPLDPARLAAEVPVGYRNLLRDTITISRVSAGTAVNVIPSTASADVDIRLLPDASPVQMVATVRQAIGQEADVEVLLAGEPVRASTINTELYQILKDVMQRADRGSVVLPVVGLGTTDSRYFRARGITAYGISPFKVNYYDIDGVHGTDERIRAKFFAEGVRLMKAVVNDFCAAP
jgi:acetylornithine deacetylase/succinyl-diaminopimelate desuccinylase-like protein